VPFDVDVGPTSGGRVLAVYSRCATEPKANGGYPAITEYQTGKGCDIFKVDLGGGGEARFTTVNASDATEFWPTYWKGRLGFARVYDSKPAYPYLYVKTVSSSSPSQRMPGGQRNECQANGPTGQPTCSDDKKSVPQELELYGTRLAFAWRYEGLSEGPDYDLRLDTVGDGHQLMDHVNNGSLTTVPIGWPSFEGGRLFWTRGCFADTGGCAGRERLVKSNYTGTISELEAKAPRPLLSHERPHDHRADRLVRRRRLQGRPAGRGRHLLDHLLAAGLRPARLTRGAGQRPRRMPRALRTAWTR
jgi:hypothetical protein